MATAVVFARDAGLPLALRAGGHSYGGWSTGRGLVLDVSRIRGVLSTVRSATVGAGARLIHVYDGVARQRMALPAGSCPTVGITGLTLGGGLGVATRAWGLTCDNLTALTVVTADGKIVEAGEAFAAPCLGVSRGRGRQPGLAPWPGSARVRLRRRRRGPAGLVTGLADVPGRMAALGTMAAAADVVHLQAAHATRPEHAAAQIGGTWIGDPAGLGRHLDDIKAAVGQAPVGNSRLPAAIWTRCSSRRDGLVGRRVHHAAHGLRGRVACLQVRAAVASGVDVRGPIERSHRERHPKQDGVAFDVLGGAVDDLAADDTAFPHRGSLAVAQYTVGWPASQSAAKVRADLAWLHGFRDAMTPYVGNTAYVNYADAQLQDWERAYYGANYPRLQQVKQRYDPDQVFTFPAVTPS